MFSLLMMEWVCDNSCTRPATPSFSLLSCSDLLIALWEQCNRLPVTSSQAGMVLFTDICLSLKIHINIKRLKKWPEISIKSEKKQVCFVYSGFRLWYHCLYKLLPPAAGNNTYYHILTVWWLDSAFQNSIQLIFIKSCSPHAHNH